MAEDVVLWTGAGNRQEKILVAHIPVQITKRRSVGDEEINVRR